MYGKMCLKCTNRNFPYLVCTALCRLSSVIAVKDYPFLMSDFTLRKLGGIWNEQGDFPVRTVSEYVDMEKGTKGSCWGSPKERDRRTQNIWQRYSLRF